MNTEPEVVGGSSTKTVTGALVTVAFAVERIYAVITYVPAAR